MKVEIKLCLSALLTSILLSQTVCAIPDTKQIEHEDTKAMVKSGLMYEKKGLSSSFGLIHEKPESQNEKRCEIEQDYRKALELYKQAANLGNAAGMYHYGRMFDYAYGVERNMPKAVEWYQKAIAKGNGNAMYRLGVLYNMGHGVKKNHKKAEQLFKKVKAMFEKVAEQGDSDALVNLGSMYENGHGVKENFSKAKELFEKAARLGNEDAQNLLKRE